MSDFPIVSSILVAIVAFIHIYIFIVDLFLWDNPGGLNAFGQTLEVARASKTLAANQGLYNGFLVAGLFWGLYLGEAGGYSIKMFFLICVILAGIYGGITAKRKILYVQAAPAIVAAIAVMLNI